MAALVEGQLEGQEQPSEWPFALVEGEEGHVALEETVEVAAQHQQEPSVEVGVAPATADLLHMLSWKHQILMLHCAVYSCIF